VRAPGCRCALFGLLLLNGTCYNCGANSKANSMASDIPIITKAHAAGGRVLRVHFAGDPRDYKLDLTGLIARSRHLARLMEDDAFAKVEIVEDGLGIAWPLETKWGRLDLSGSTLRKIAEEQLPMTGADFGAKKAGSLAHRRSQVARRRAPYHYGVFEKKRTTTCGRHRLSCACSR
jgi:hypothetical protein